MNSEYNKWLGKTEIYQEYISEINAKRLYNTLTQSGNPPLSGEVVFPLFLLTLGEPSVPPDQLGEDGHPKRGLFMPPIQFKRRMFAGAEYEFYKALRVGDEVKTTWHITDIIQKEGSSGKLVFVNILKEFHVKGTLCAIEKRNIVFTNSAPKIREFDDPESRGEWVEEMRTNPLQLFRYSALTFNCHRIHYDRKYATEVEAYPGLVVHGPLLATWLSLFAFKKSCRELKKFRFRAKRPVFDLHNFYLTGDLRGKDTAKLRVLDHKYQLAILAEAEFHH